MNTPQSITRDPRQTDAEHLRLLAVFHFVFAGLALFGLLMLSVQFTLMHSLFSDPRLWKNAQGGPPPEAFLSMMTGMLVFFGALMVLGGILNLLSGVWILRRRHRIFSLVVAGFNCVQIPFGTILGAFTFIVLLRESVREAYAA